VAECGTVRLVHWFRLLPLAGVQAGIRWRRLFNGMQPHPESGSTANSYVILAKLATGGMARSPGAQGERAGIER